MDFHREMMDKVLQSILKSKTSPVLKDDKYEVVINFLKHPSTCTDKHQYLPQGIIPEFPKVLAEHLPNVLNRVLHIQLKPLPKNIKKHEVDFLCLM